MTRPQSGDGLVFPEGFPCKASQINAETIETAGGNLRAMGATVDSHMDNIVSTWNGLPAVYAGPGAEQAYALMTPAAAASEELKQALSKAGEAIEEYAHTLVPVKTALSNLEMEAAAFRTKVLAGEYGDDWRADPEAVTANTAFLTRYAAIYEALTTAAATCANAIYAQLTRTSALEATGVSAESILDGGGLMPWGSPMPHTPSCNESALQGAGKLQPTTWDAILNLHGYNQLLQGPYGLSPSWIGAGDFAGASSLYLTLTNPATGGMLPTDDDEEKRKKLEDLFNKPKRAIYTKQTWLDDGLDWVIDHVVARVREELEFTLPRLVSGSVAMQRHLDAWRVFSLNAAPLLAPIPGARSPMPAAVGASAVGVFGTSLGVAGNLITGKDVGLFSTGKPFAGWAEEAPTGNAPTTDMTSLTKNTMAAYDMYDPEEQPNEHDQGAVRVEGVVGSDGKGRYIVSIPGTQADIGTLAAWSDNSNGRNWYANIDVMSRGSEAANAQATMMAIRHAVPANSEILLTGHSQGGLIAANLASDPEFTSDYKIAGIVGYGAPMDAAHRDPSIPVLDIHHDQDPIPTLDLADIRPDDTNITLTRPEGSPTILNPGAFIWDQHSQDSYQESMENLPPETAATVNQFVKDNNLDRFFTPENGTSHVWRVRISTDGD